MIGSTSRLRTASIAVGLVVVAVLGCGPKGGHPAGGPSAPVGPYAGLRWVPADATYALVTRRAEDLLLLVRDLIDAAGILHDEDAGSVGADAKEDLGFDPLDLSALAGLGIDPARGMALWSRGIGPSIALPLADPARFAAVLDERRSRGAVVQVAKVGAVEVYTWRPEREIAMHWAIVDDWFLAHLELTEEREPALAWFETALAARGRFATDPDFTAARDGTAARLGAEPALVGLARVPALFATALGPELQPCRDTFGRLGRVALGATSDGKDARAALIAALPGGAAGIRALQLPVPAGWDAARGDAPLQVEVGLDLRALAPLWTECLDGDDLFRDLVAAGISGGRAFARTLDIGGLDGTGAAAVVGERRVFTDALDEIPALDFLQKQRKVGAVAVFDVNVPMVPRFSYGFLDTTAVIAAGTAIDPIVTGGLVGPGDGLALLEVRPQAWPAAHWDALAGLIKRDDDERAAAIRRLRKWSLGRIAVGLDGDAVVIDLHGVR